MALAAAFTAGMLSWWAWRERGKRIYLLGFYGFMALGMLAKGPVAPFLAGLIIVLYASWARELRLILKMLWWPGIILFGAIALPWYVAVQVRNPEFFRQFIVEHNLGRFAENIYHHTQPFWYYVPVAALALVPWTVFAIAGFAQPLSALWKNRKRVPAATEDFENHFGVFAACWLIVPVIFFSISKSKLPGYILPAAPAGALLLVEYLRRHLESGKSERAPVWLVALHALTAAMPIIPALLIAYLVTDRRVPPGRPMLVALAVAFILCAGIALTLIRPNGLRMLRFVTLIPVVLTVAAVLKLGSVPLDRALSVRPLAQEIAGIETQKQLLAVYHVPRELEYGLTFYRNQETFNYDWGSVPSQEHLLVAPEGSQSTIAELVAGRRVSYLGNYTAQHMDYYWIAAAGANLR